MYTQTHLSDVPFSPPLSSFVIPTSHCVEQDDTFVPIRCMLDRSYYCIPYILSPHRKWSNVTIDFIYFFYLISPGWGSDSSSNLVNVQQGSWVDHTTDHDHSLI